MTNFNANDLESLLDVKNYHDGCYKIPTEYLVDTATVSDGYFRDYRKGDPVYEGESVVLTISLCTYGEYVGSIYGRANFEYIEQRYRDRFGEGIWELRGDHDYHSILIGIGCPQEFIDELIGLTENGVVFDQDRYDRIKDEMYTEAWNTVYHADFLKEIYKQFELNDPVKWYLQDCENVEVEHLYPITQQYYETLQSSGDYYREMSNHVECYINYAVRKMDRDMLAKMIRELRSADRAKNTK